MKKGLLKIFAAALVLSVALSGILVSFSSCGENKVVEDPIFECGESKMPLYFYEYMLSQKRGELSSAKYDVKSEKFWSTVTESGQTYEEYFNREVLESCKYYFAASVIFDRKGLKLPSATLAEIDESIEFLLDYDADGDVEKFNSLIADFGVDKDELRECYIILAKKDVVIDSIYGADGSLIADSFKNQYYKENYFRFKQILFRNYYYEYETDQWGQEIYFDPETGKPLYDKENGEFRFDADGFYIKDSYGETIYFDGDGKAVYDTEKGERSAKLDGGEAIAYDYSKEELQARYERARALAEGIGKKNYSHFESELEKIVEEEDLGNSYPEGYYVSDIESVTYTEKHDYMNDILALLKTMDEGEVKFFESEFGYHVIMKYKLDDGRFADGEYAEWFNSFTSSLISEMFDGELQKVLPEISSNEENLAKARSIKNIGTNYDY